MTESSDFCGDNLVGENLQWKIELIEGGNIIQTLKDEGVEISFRTLDGFNGDVHTIRWTVRDGCGNVSVDTTHVGYIDIQAPSPVCLPSLNVGIDSSGLVWAKDFDFGSFDNCTAMEDLRFSIVPNGTEPVQPTDPNFGDESSLEFSCEDQMHGDLFRQKTPYLTLSFHGLLWRR